MSQGCTGGERVGDAVDGRPPVGARGLPNQSARCFEVTEGALRRPLALPAGGGKRLHRGPRAVAFLVNVGVKDEKNDLLNGRVAVRVPDSPVASEPIHDDTWAERRGRRLAALPRGTWGSYSPSCPPRGPWQPIGAHRV